MDSALAKRFREALVGFSADSVSARFVNERTDSLLLRQGVLQPPSSSIDAGVMVTVGDGTGRGYCATTDLSISGLRRSMIRAKEWAESTQNQSVTDFGCVSFAAPRGEYVVDALRPWDGENISGKLDLINAASAAMAIDDAIVDWQAGLMSIQSETLFVTGDGGELYSRVEYIVPQLAVFANRGSETQRRTCSDACKQGGLEVVEDSGFCSNGARLAREALALLDASRLQDEKMDLLLAPDQMMLQIHESIGHPIELDRILGDERNYAGGSFVSADMIGSYTYGSELLNVSFDPGVAGEFASYAFDDDGAEAKRQMLIERGMLVCGIGGTISQARLGLPGVACSRATSWNRPPIDRMANINVEAGDSTFDELVAGVERGVYLQTNRSWSIDDSRNKFQFGCELGYLIKDGELGEMVKNPNYRGISATFWRNLKGVGKAREVFGSPYCGKGEPNQIIRVGHASPPWLFADVEVFAG